MDSHSVRDVALGEIRRGLTRDWGPVLSVNNIEMLTTEQLAEMLQVHERHLRRMRADGSGPPFVAFGERTVRYPAADVAAWMAERSQTRLDEAV